MWRWASRSPAVRDPALDELVGFFVNTLVLRVDLAGDPTFAELLAQVRAPQPGRLRTPGRAVRGARRAAQPDPQLTHHPLVQVMLAWQNYAAATPGAGLALGDLQVTPLPVDTHTARMDLAFSLAERCTEDGEPGDRRHRGVPHRRVRRGQHRDVRGDGCGGCWWR